MIAVLSLFDAVKFPERKIRLLQFLKLYPVFGVSRTRSNQCLLKPTYAIIKKRIIIISGMKLD